MSRQHCPEAEALVAFLYDEFDGVESGAGSAGAGAGSAGSPVFDRRAIARHLDGCRRCAAELASLGGVRRTLREWAAPDLSLGFRVVSDPPRRVAWLPAWSIPALPLAAAAVLVLGAALGVARLDVQYDSQQGLRIRTGWGHAETSSAANAGFTPPAPPIHVGVRPVTPAPETTATPWRAEMDALMRQVRQEMTALRNSAHAGDRVSAANVVADDPSVPGNQPLLRRVQQLIDQSEVRQQQNLALRAAELLREFDVRRRSDLVQIEQGFGRLANQRAQDAETQRQFLNSIRGVSQQQPPQ